MSSTNLMTPASHRNGLLDRKRWGRRRRITPGARSPPRPGPRRSLPLQHRQDVPGRVLEPGDQGPTGPDDALLVRFDAWEPLHLDAAGGEFSHRLIDVLDREVQDREGGR